MCSRKPYRSLYTRLEPSLKTQVQSSALKRSSSEGGSSELTLYSVGRSVQLWPGSASSRARPTLPKPDIHSGFARGQSGSEQILTPRIPM